MAIKLPPAPKLKPAEYAIRVYTKEDGEPLVVTVIPSTLEGGDDSLLIQEDAFNKLFGL